MQTGNDKVRDCYSHSVSGETFKDEVVFEAQEKDGAVMGSPGPETRGK